MNASAMRASWADPADDRPGAAKHARSVSGYRQFCPLRKCRLAYGDRCGYTVEHIVAADRLRALADGAAIGFSGGRGLLPIWGVAYQPSTGPGQAALRTARAWIGFRRAMAMFSASEREMVTHVVLLNWSLRRWIGLQRARHLPAHPVTERQRLVAVLDRLAQHFSEEVRRDIERGAVV